MADKNTIKNWFLTNFHPTQAQFWALFDSYFHKDEKIPITAIDDIENILADKADAEVLAHHLTDLTAHADLFDAKEDKTKRGAALGYAPLNEFTKLAIDYLNVVNDLVTGGESSLLTAEQGKLLQVQITAINTLLTSNDVNLDTVQEIVTAIKTVQTSLSTILVNDLTTGGTTKALTAEMGKLLQTNKVDKVTGKGLSTEDYTTDEKTKLLGLSNITTTIKSILSTALASQDVAGMVSYINALATILVVGNNETVKYKTTDTGRIFELLLRGRSFGVGQPAIVAADILEVTEFLNKDLKFSNYPSTRNDGQLPTNRVLSTDANGNLKMYTIATAPAPYISELIPDSYLPSTTGNIRILGDFFIPAMCDRVNNASAIVIGGVSVINYATFISSKEIKVNVTTGSVEGSFAITLNNGLSTIKNNALLIILGTVYKPIASEWEAPTGNINIDQGDAAVLNIYNVIGTNRWNRIFDVSKNIYIQFFYKRSPLGNIISEYRQQSFQLIDAVTLAVKFSVSFQGDNTYLMLNLWSETMGWTSNPYPGAPELTEANVLQFRKIGTTMYFYMGNALTYTFTDTVTNNLKLKVSLKSHEITKIKYIELV